MITEEPLKEMELAPCALRDKLKCPNMRERDNCQSMSYEHYDCKVCGEHIALDYDEMR